MTYYVVCPECGYKLLKAGDGFTIEIYCPKCKGKFLIAVKDGKVTHIDDCEKLRLYFLQTDDFFVVKKFLPIL